jgi:hypothetical protein
MSLATRGRFSKGGITQIADTVIDVLIPPKKNAFTVLTTIRYNVGTTAHTLTVMKPQGVTTLASVAASGQADVVLTADPGAAPQRLGPNNTASQLATNLIAANDYVAFEMPDGTFYFDTVASVASLTITLTNNLPTNGIAVGAKCWFFGVAGDSDPFTGQAFYPLIVTAAGSGTVTRQWQDKMNGVVSSNRPYEPLLLHSDNGTTAGKFDLVNAVYSNIG